MAVSTVWRVEMTPDEAGERLAAAMGQVGKVRRFDPADRSLEGRIWFGGRPVSVDVVWETNGETTGIHVQASAPEVIDFASDGALARFEHAFRSREGRPARDDPSDPSRFLGPLALGMVGVLCLVLSVLLVVFYPRS